MLCPPPASFPVCSIPSPISNPSHNFVVYPYHGSSCTNKYIYVYLLFFIFAQQETYLSYSFSIYFFILTSGLGIHFISVHSALLHSFILYCDCGLRTLLCMCIYVVSNTLQLQTIVQESPCAHVLFASLGLYLAGQFLPVRLLGH